MNNTQLQLYQNEIRFLTIELWQVNDKQQLIDFNPVTVTVTIYNNDTGAVVVQESTAQISGNKAGFMITPANLTTRLGEFKAVWKVTGTILGDFIGQGNETFFHKTFLEIRAV